MDIKGCVGSKARLAASILWCWAVYNSWFQRLVWDDGMACTVEYRPRNLDNLVAVSESSHAAFIPPAKRRLDLVMRPGPCVRVLGLHRAIQSSTK